MYAQGINEMMQIGPAAAQVKQLTAFHFSPRYMGMEQQMRQEVETAYENSFRQQVETGLERWDR